MALASPARIIDVSAALTALEPLGEDEYFVACGPAGTQFCGTPNGYCATLLPQNVVQDLMSGKINSVKWASFGDDHRSYFFAYETKDGHPTFRTGKAIPSSLKTFIDYATSNSFDLASTLRVQLGAKRSYVAWAGGLWACRNIPRALRSMLYQLSSAYTEDKRGSKGTLKSGSLANVTWHDSGSFYLQGEKHFWNIESDVMQQGWNALWGKPEDSSLTPRELADLAYVGIDPHSPGGNTFVFIKKRQHPNREPDFVLRFGPEDMVCRLSEGSEQPEDFAAQLPSLGQNEINVREKRTQEPFLFRWAFSKKAGRPHSTELWEVDLKKGEKLKVIRDMGRDWYIVLTQKGVKGWVHGSWLDFRDVRMRPDPRDAYARFAADMDEVLQPGALRSFPNLSRYLNTCEKDVCTSLKASYPGICAHDLHELLRGSGQYSQDFLKVQRNKWHPDKFARYCHADHRDELKVQAEALFVLFGVLMDWTENRPE